MNAPSAIVLIAMSGLALPSVLLAADPASDESAPITRAAPRSPSLPPVKTSNLNLSKRRALSPLPRCRVKAEAEAQAQAQA
ncbi:hypothetical protein CCR96_08195 [Halochromatium roseum]|nr:hypothetical protein [Halochromatium roseum]